MKKFTAILMSVICMLAFAACSANTGSDGSESYAKDWGITLTVKDVTSSGLTLACSQSGGIAKGSLETGSEYWLEKLENNVWIKVQPAADPVWDMMSHLIPRDETIEWNLNWTWLYGEIGAGNYRICKTIMDFADSGVSESQFYCAEFEIES